MIRLLKKAMQFVCLALMLVVLMAVVSVADGDMPLLNGVILGSASFIAIHQLSAGRKSLPWNLVQAGR